MQHDKENRGETKDQTTIHRALHQELDSFDWGVTNIFTNTKPLHLPLKFYADLSNFMSRITIIIN